MLSRRKLRRLTFKSFRVGEADWRGLLALSLTLGYITLLALRTPGVEPLGFAVGLVAGWYFGGLRAGKPKHPAVRPLKIPRATEKHPDFPALKRVLVEAVRQEGNYNPAYDEPLIDELAKILLDLRSADELIDKAVKEGNLKDFQAALKAKVNLLSMLRSTADSLAVSRRLRLGRQGERKFRETMAERLLALISGGKLEESRGRASSKRSQSVG
ncbi:MAG: hypothetical protein ACXQTV_01990 [Candidatus Hecatellaceae archaeon]